MLREVRRRALERRRATSPTAPPAAPRRDVSSRSAAGASSRTTCAFVPPMPREFTPARRGGRLTAIAASSCSRKTGCRRSRSRHWALRNEDWRNRLVSKRQRRLDQPGDPCGCVQVSDVGLDRAEAQYCFRPVFDRNALVKRRHLDRIAKLGGAPVRLDVADGVRIDARTGRARRVITSACPSRSAP